MTVYLCGNVMAFPWALRLGWINGWILSLMVLFISSIVWSKVLINMPMDKYAENISNEEIIEQIQVNEMGSDSPVDTEENICVLTINELIDLGFSEKYLNNYENAASYFARALSKDPSPDLAFSLIIDCYWLWNSLGERDDAILQLQTYVQKYLPLFNTALRLEFDTWIMKGNLQIILEK